MADYNFDDYTWMDWITPSVVSSESQDKPSSEISILNLQDINHYIPTTDEVLHAPRIAHQRSQTWLF